MAHVKQLQQEAASAKNYEGKEGEALKQLGPALAALSWKESRIQELEAQNRQQAARITKLEPAEKHLMELQTTLKDRKHLDWKERRPQEVIGACLPNRSLSYGIGARFTG